MNFGQSRVVVDKDKLCLNINFDQIKTFKEVTENTVG